MSGEHDIVYAATIAAVPATIAAVAALSAARNGRRNRRAITTGNEKDIGVTVHDIAQTVELTSAQVHTNTRELLDISSKLDAHLEETSAMKAKK